MKIGARSRGATYYLTVVAVALLLLCKYATHSFAYASTHLQDTTTTIDSHHHLSHHYRHRPLQQQQRLAQSYSTSGDSRPLLSDADHHYGSSSSSRDKQSRFDYWLSMASNSNNNKNEELGLKLMELELLSPKKSALYYLDEQYLSVQVRQQRQLLTLLQQLKNQTAWPLASIVASLTGGGHLAAASVEGHYQQQQPTTNLLALLSKEDRVRLLTGSALNAIVMNSLDFNATTTATTTTTDYSDKSNYLLSDGASNEIHLIKSLYDDDRQLMIDNNNVTVAAASNDASATLTTGDDTAAAPAPPFASSTSVDAAAAAPAKTLPTAPANDGDCTRTNFDELNVKYSGVYESKLHRLYKQQAQLAVDNSNLITNLLVHSDNQLLSKYLKRRFFRFLVKSNVQTDEKILASGLIFTSDPSTAASLSSSLQPVRRSALAFASTPPPPPAAAAKQLTCSNSTANGCSKPPTPNSTTTPAEVATTRRKRQYLSPHFLSSSSQRQQLHTNNDDNLDDNNNNDDHHNEASSSTIYAPTVYRKLTTTTTTATPSSHKLSVGGGADQQHQQHTSDSTRSTPPTSSSSSSSSSSPSSSEFTYVDLGQHHVAGMHSGSVNSYFKPNEPIDFYKFWQQTNHYHHHSSSGSVPTSSTSSSSSSSSSSSGDNDNSSAAPIEELIKRLHKQQHHYNITTSSAASGQQQRAATFNLYYTDGRWSAPYLDCGVTNTWLITYSVPFFSLDPSHPTRAHFRGVSFVSLDLASTRLINQCAKSDNEALFAQTNQCGPIANSECIPLEVPIVRRGSYACQCKKGYYVPKKFKRYTMPRDLQAYLKSMRETTTTTTNSMLNPLLLQSDNFYLGAHLERLHISNYIDSGPDNQLAISDLRCDKCRFGCDSCDNEDETCTIDLNTIIRFSILVIQSFCVTLVLMASFLIFRLRKSRIVASSRWIMLETMLLGSLLVYLSVIIRYFNATILSCFLEPWLRELGFSIFYGSIMIKIYRIYTEFQTRKAHRVCFRDKDLIMYLSAIVLIVIGYMSAWTALVTDGFYGKTTPTLYPFSSTGTAAGAANNNATASQAAQQEQLFAMLLQQQQQQRRRRQIADKVSSVTNNQQDKPYNDIDHSSDNSPLAYSGRRPDDTSERSMQKRSTDDNTSHLLRIPPHETSSLYDIVFDDDMTTTNNNDAASYMSDYDADRATNSLKLFTLSNKQNGANNSKTTVPDKQAIEDYLSRVNSIQEQQQNDTERLTQSNKQKRLKLAQALLLLSSTNWQPNSESSKTMNSVNDSNSSEHLATMELANDRRKEERRSHDDDDDQNGSSSSFRFSGAIRRARLNNKSSNASMLRRNHSAETIVYIHQHQQLDGAATTVTGGDDGNSDASDTDAAAAAGVVVVVNGGNNQQQQPIDAAKHTKEQSPISGGNLAAGEPLKRWDRINNNKWMSVDNSDKRNRHRSLVNGEERRHSKRQTLFNSRQLFQAYDNAGQKLIAVTRPTPMKGAPVISSSGDRGPIERPKSNEYYYENVVDEEEPRSGDKINLNIASRLSAESVIGSNDGGNLVDSRQFAIYERAIRRRSLHSNIASSQTHQHQQQPLLQHSSTILETVDGLTRGLLDPLMTDNDLSDTNWPSIIERTSLNGLRFARCRKLTWDYVTEISEFVFLLGGVYLTYRIRNARRDVYREKLVLCLSIYIELIVSSVTYVLRHTFWHKIHPDQLFLLYLLRCQLTVTVALIMIIGPKLWNHNRNSLNNKANLNSRHRCHLSCELHDHHLNDAMRLHAAMLSNGAVDIGNINLADMDPEDIQAELRRVYSQLQVYKNKVMRRENPHISKRRGGKKTGHRKFSLQAFHSKHQNLLSSSANNKSHNKQQQLQQQQQNNNDDTSNQHNKSQSTLAGIMSSQCHQNSTSSGVYYQSNNNNNNNSQAKTKCSHNNAGTNKQLTSHQHHENGAMFSLNNEHDSPSSGNTSPRRQSYHASQTSIHIEESSVIE